MTGKIIIKADGDITEELEKAIGDAKIKNINVMSIRELDYEEVAGCDGITKSQFRGVPMYVANNASWDDPVMAFIFGIYEPKYGKFNFDDDVVIVKYES